MSCISYPRICGHPVYIYIRTYRIFSFRFICLLSLSITMDHGILRDLWIPYLRAIQKVPGNTASEKFRWIGKLTSRQAIEDFEQFSPELLPILRIETAIKKKKHEDITLALKCEDSTIINRALKASWFFDGSHKKIIDVAYFCERLFPYVSINTRTRIVFALAHRLSGKDPVFAQEMFTAVASIYGVHTAYPLMMACDEAFGYKMIVEKELVLPVGIVKKIFRKNPDLIVRFLKLLRPYEPDATERTPFAIGIDKYKSLLPKLIKKRLEAFVELYEVHEINPPNIILSNTCAEIFLKKAQQYLIKKPQLYIRILPLKKINDNLMESVFSGLLPTKVSSFNTNIMLDYLKYYPRDKQYDLLRKSYKNKYNADLVDETENVTSALLQLLPAEERIKQARIKIQNQNLRKNYENTIAYETAWICYLSVNETIPVIKEKISKTPNEADRIGFLLQMIYVCKINNDDNALSDTLIYILNRHKNENPWLFEKIFDQLSRIYDLPLLSEKQISLVLDIVRLFYVKNGFIPDNILLALIHFKLVHNMSIEALIDMFLENNHKYFMNFNILKEYPQYERQCLVIFANQMEKKSFEDLDKKRDYFRTFVVAMYDFNNRCKNKIEKMSIRDYPWLMKVIQEICLENMSKKYYCDVEDVLQKNEPELYRSWFPSKIANVTTGSALALLKRDLQNILDNWEEYLTDCMKRYHLKHVQHFVRATRWYKDLPIKFVERCMNYMHDESTDNMSSSVVILAILLHGDELTKLIDPLIPTETTVDTNYPNAKDNYKIIRNLSLSIKLSNPPVPLDLVVRLCVGDYLSTGLMTLTNVSRRTFLPKVISVAQKLTSMRVSTRKHGIRLMSLIGSVSELMNFLQETWANESHYSVRQVLFEAIQKFFLTKPSSETWSLYCQTMSTLNLKDEALLLQVQLFREISNEYVEKYLKLWLKTIDNLQEMGLEDKKTNNYIANYLKTLTKSIFNLLPEEFAENILRRFLFHIDSDVSEAAKCFTISYILSEDQDKYAARVKVFADVFCNAVTTYWNVPDPENLRSYPVNRAVRLFINDFVDSYITKFNFNKSLNPKIIDNMQMIFSSALSPSQEPWSYLLLVYVKHFLECTSTKAFGLKLGQKLHELIDIFSSLLVSFMVDILKYFLNIAYDSSDWEEVKLSIIEGLIEAGNTESCFMAVKMLPSTIQTKHGARYDRIIEKFREMHEERTITAALYNYLNVLENSN